MVRLRKIISLLLFLLITIIQIPSFEQAEEYVSLNNLIEETGTRFRWEPFQQKGELSLGMETIIFQIGVPVLLLNYEHIVPAGNIVRGNDGVIYFSTKGAEAVRRFFRPLIVDPDQYRIAAIIIDPGHGGRDPGAVGRHKTNDKLFEIKEKDVVLDVSLQVFDKLKSAFPNRNIIITREDDTYLTLEERTEIANAVYTQTNEAIIFVSIHANASLNSRAKGYEVWYLPPDYRRELIKPEDVDETLLEAIPILNTMLEEEFAVGSILLGSKIVSSIEQSVGERSINRGLKEESWFVVRNAMMPSVLVELGFLTNEDEAMLLNDELYLMKLAQGVYTGIKAFIEHIEMPRDWDNSE